MIAPDQHGDATLGIISRIIGIFTGRNASSPASSGRPKPPRLPTARPLPVAAQLPPHAPLTAAQEASAPFANRYTNPSIGAPLEQWVRTRSTWIYAARFDPYPTDITPGQPTYHPATGRMTPTGIKGDLTLEMTDGAVLLFANSDQADWLELFHAPSKGRWLTNWPRKSNYVTTRPTQYHGAALAARVQANA